MTDLPHPVPAHVRVRRVLGALGSLLAALAVAASAYAMHGTSGHAREQLALGAAFAFAHGLALAALAPLAVRRDAVVALAGMAAGAMLFAGSLAAAALLGSPTTLAPAGGVLLIAAWLLHGWGRLRG